MDIKKMITAQKELSEKIIKTKGLEGANLLPNLILALRVELGELANEERSWKYWSDDREPRSFGKCQSCFGEGKGFFSGEKWSGSQEPCFHCKGTGKNGTRPILEEYVDCISFVLEIGINLGYSDQIEITFTVNWNEDKDITNALNKAFFHVSDLQKMVNYQYKRAGAIKEKFLALFTNLIKLGLLLGFDLDTIETAYFEKNLVNLARQDNHY